MGCVAGGREGVAEGEGQQAAPVLQVLAAGGVAVTPVTMQVYDAFSWLDLLLSDTRLRAFATAAWQALRRKVAVPGQARDTPRRLPVIRGSERTAAGPK